MDWATAAEIDEKGNESPSLWNLFKQSSEKNDLISRSEGHGFCGVRASVIAVEIERWDDATRRKGSFRMGKSKVADR